MIVYFGFDFDRDTTEVIHAALDEYVERHGGAWGDMPEVAKIARSVRDQMAEMLEKVERR
jgi:hypothetical protein